MISKLLILFCALYTVSSKNVNFKNEEQNEVGDLSWRQEAGPDLVWPDTYTFETTKMHLSSGLVEHTKYWRLSDSGNTYSRLDFNDGAVKRITLHDDYSPFGLAYEIHPETTEEKSNKIVCYKATGSKSNKLEPIDGLPDLDNFDKAVEDSIKGVDCVKFTYEAEGLNKRMKKTLWAYYDNSTETLAWVPVRYEEQCYNTWHGYISDHHILDIYNFHFQKNDVLFSDFQVRTPEECIQNDEEIVMRSANKGVATLKSDDEDHLNHGFSPRLQRASSGTAEDIAFPYTQQELKQLAESLPSKYDARLEGLVGPVLNQEDCKASYSFVATAAVEGALARSNGQMLIKLANQALVDCSWGYGNKGCKEGSNEGSFKWIMEHGLPTELDYGTYAVEAGYCNMENVTNTYEIRGFTKVTPVSIDALKIALVNHGPLAVKVDATVAFESYDQGIFYDTHCSSTDLNHSVLLVGYGEKDGEEFWIIKNSWGPTWGIGGYMHISMRDNNCGVATEPFYVVI